MSRVGQRLINSAKQALDSMESNKIIDEFVEIVNERDALREELKKVSDRQAMLMNVRATIIVNAMRSLNCNFREAEAYALGTSKQTFINAIVEHVEAKDPDKRVIKIAEFALDQWEAHVRDSLEGTGGLVKALADIEEKRLELRRIVRYAGK